MNQRMAVLAVAGVLALPMIAHAQTANVTLYGRVNLDYEIVNGRQADGSNPKGEPPELQLITLWTARRRVARRRLERDLPGRKLGRRRCRGWHSPVAKRTSACKGIGELRLGNFLSPYYDYIHPTFGNVPTLLTSILSTGALWAGGGGGLTTATGSFQNRAGNSVRYDSPSYSGFNGSVEYDTRESANHAGIISIGGAYANGPLQLGTAYTRNRKVRGVDFDDSAFSATAAYKFDIVRIAGVYEHPDYEVASGDLKRDFWGISGTMSAG